MDIAIIGTAYDLPKTETYEQFRDVIMNGKVMSSSEENNENVDNKNFVSTGYFLENRDLFFPQIFNISPEQAKHMDPQHRRLLMMVRKMLLEYGLSEEVKKSTTGVYTAVGASDYFIKNILSNETIDSVQYSTYIDNLGETAASKIAYYFDLKGHAININSACSSSAMALYFAAKDIESGKVSEAIVGTSNIGCSDRLGYRYVEGGIFSKSGTCSPFDVKSDGIVPGYGTIVFTLKGLSDAERDKNDILAVIKGIGTSNDGKMKAGYTAPSVDGQCRAILDAYRNIDINISNLDYLETHGTGTAIGDAIEAETIYKMFGTTKSKIHLGSVKANFGHLDCASAMLSLLKVIFMLKEQIIPKEANFESINPLIATKEDKLTFDVVSKKAVLKNIGINSFGIGGTNCHIVVGKYYSADKEIPENTDEIFTVPVYSRYAQNHMSHVKEVFDDLKNSSRTELFGKLKNLKLFQPKEENATNLFVKYNSSLNIVEIFEGKNKEEVRNSAKSTSDLLHYSRKPIAIERLTEGKYWISSKAKESVRVATENDIDKEEIIKFLTDYLVEDFEGDIRTATIDDLELESFMVLDLIEAFNKRFGANVEFSMFQNPSSQVLPIFMNSINNEEGDSEKTYNVPPFMQIIGGFDPSKTSLFLIHPAGGSVTGYNHFFNKINLKYNLVLISFPFDELDILEQYTLVQLATFYKNGIRKLIEKSKDIVIGGYSFGGNVAFEIVRQIQEEDNFSPNIIMIDSHPIEAYTSNVKLVSNSSVEKMKEELVKQGVIDESFPENLVDTYSKVWTLNHKMLKGYILSDDKKVTSKLFILICKEEENKELLEELAIKYLDKRMWQKYFESPIEVAYVEGNHYSIYSNKNLGLNIGKEIDKFMLKVISNG